MAAGLAGLAAAGLAGACGGDDVGPADVDAGIGGQATLEVNEDASLGVAFGGSETLSVTYLDASGRPIPRASVEFSMRTDASEDTGGATLSATRATTDEDGVAEVELVAGAERVNFRVEASAPNAPSATFYIAVSEDGFTDILVTPRHDGFRSADDVLPVEVRLYPATDYRCADIPLDAIPDSVFPIGAIDAWDQSAAFPNRSSGEGYTVLAFSAAGDVLYPIASGCADLAADQVRPGDRLALSLAVVDRPVSAPADPAEVVSTFDLALVEDALAEAGALAAWETAELCPEAAGQLVLDCAQSALSGELDCDPAGDHELIDELEASRGDPDEDGCRPGEVGGESTLDREVALAVEDGALSGDDTLASLAADLGDTLSDLVIESELTFTSADAARHQLERFRFTAAGDAFPLDLAATARPRVVAEGIPVSFSSPSGGELTVGRHGFSGRLGSAAARAFRALALAPRGVDAPLGELGHALVEGAEAEGESGCAAVSALACDAIGEPADCLEAACDAGAGELAARLSEWAERADGGELDFELSGTAPVSDDSGDFVLDTIGGGGTAGTWAATVIFGDGTEVDFAGSFGGEVPPRGDDDGDGDGDASQSTERSGEADGEGEAMEIEPSGEPSSGGGGGE